jgi:hypothetical protein
MTSKKDILPILIGRLPVWFLIFATGFIAAGTRLYDGKFSYSATNVLDLFHQSPKNMSIDFIRQAKEVKNLSEGHIILTSSLLPTSGSIVWSQFSYYRSVTRAELRRLCKNQGMSIDYDTSLQTMITFLERSKVIETSFANSLRKIASVTYIVAWGTGEPPTEPDAEFVAKNAISLIEKLQKIN